jgi:urocanate hydratase
MGKSIHAGQVVVADGSSAAGERVRRTLTADPGLGVVRHADAGYPEALAAAREQSIKMPMLDPEPDVR